MLRFFEKLLSFITAAALATIVALVFINVVMRYVLNSGLTWSEEIAVNLFVWVIFLGAILAGLEGRHIRIDLLTSNLPVFWQKVFFVVSSLCALFALGVLFVGGIGVTRVAHGNISGATGIPFSYVCVAVIVGAACLAVITVFDVYKMLRSK